MRVKTSRRQGRAGPDRARLDLDHVAARERIEHPLNRLMETLPVDDGLDIATTDIHLPQRLGEALKHAYGGELDINYAARNRSVLVTWRRDA
jgi:hypothetical protein